MEDLNSFRSPLSTRYASKEMLYNFSEMKKATHWRKLWVNLAEAQKELNQQCNVVSQNGIQVRPIKGINKNVNFGPIQHYLEAANAEMPQIRDSMFVYNNNLYRVDGGEMPVEYDSQAMMASTSSPLAHTAQRPFHVNMPPIASTQVGVPVSAPYAMATIRPAASATPGCHPALYKDCLFMSNVVDASKHVDTRDEYKAMRTNPHRFAHNEFCFENEPSAPTSTSTYNGPMYSLFAPSNPEQYSYQDIIDLDPYLRRFRSLSSRTPDQTRNGSSSAGNFADRSDATHEADVGPSRPFGFHAKPSFQFNGQVSTSGNPHRATDYGNTFQN